MYPELFKGLGIMEPKHLIKLNDCITSSASTKEEADWFTWKIKERIGQLWENWCNKEGRWTYRMGQFNGCGGETQWWVKNLSESKGPKQRNQKSITSSQHLKKLQADWVEKKSLSR